MGCASAPGIDSEVCPNVSEKTSLPTRLPHIFNGTKKKVEYKPYLRYSDFSCRETKENQNW
ncbi:MAG: hypothetical protein GPOALKHO_000752 [Sodalis sp.]|nr:MAG: hypothetical protein GPOALKHO_000752 [Sodalis sp.]